MNSRFVFEKGRRRLIFAHRGARSVAPENTIAAARRAIELGADGWEFDVRLTSDFVPVVIHDATLERTSDVAERPEFAGRKPWPVDEFTLDELKTLDFGSWYGLTDPFGVIASKAPEAPSADKYNGERIPTLAEALDFIKKSSRPANLEIKDLFKSKTGIAAQVLGMIEAAGLSEMILVSSFNFEYLKDVKRLSPETPTGVLVKKSPGDPVALVRELGAEAYHPGLDAIDPEWFPALHKAGVMINVWNINLPDQAQGLVEAGADTIITDFPQWMKFGW